MSVGTCIMVLFSFGYLLIAALVASNESRQKPRCANDTVTDGWMCDGNEKDTCLRRDYYYDDNEQTCKFLGYMGCNGSSNNYPSLFSCLAECRRNNLTSKAMAFVNHVNCTTKYNPATDNGTITRYYYNSSSNECVSVLVSKGDAYFPQRSYCEQKCNATQPSLSQCTDTKNNGTAPPGWTCSANETLRYTTCRNNTDSLKLRLRSASF
uniref:Pancreatic trypsin inhibitor n=1 Tax=Rhipicephalus zambeziensis TaxID=60191 RepID=A0A224Y2D5_9ACAR